MFSQPEDHNLSLRLSQALNDIGVNETTIMKRRKAWMLEESFENTRNFFRRNYINNHILRELNLTSDKKRTSNYSVFFLGSQIEGSTTPGLNSDIDKLECCYEHRIIQDLTEWEKLPEQFQHMLTRLPELPGIQVAANCASQPDKQFMMVQDELTSPGHCLLQLMRDDLPLPSHDSYSDCWDKELTKDGRGRVLLRHSVSLGDHPFEKLLGKRTVRHGPALIKVQKPETDIVLAFHCPSWPKEAESWLHQKNLSGWPTEEMKKYSAEQGCFVVAKSSKEGMYEDLEWRISTSMAERCLMFNINITQMRCYILMKMILKTFLKPKCGEAISSFMCKNILFYCIAESENSSTWNESSLLTYLRMCLQSLLNSIRTENCPHFMIPRNNLLAGKLSADVRRQLVGVMCRVTENIWQSLLSIEIDNLNNHLQLKLGGISHFYVQINAQNISIDTTAKLNRKTADHLLELTSFLHSHLSKEFASTYQMLIDYVIKHCQAYNAHNTAFSIYGRFLCSQIGSIIASKYKQHYQGISAEALIWFTVGLNSDISSSKLKLASALYCAGDLEKCEIILDALRIRLSQTWVMSLGLRKPKGFSLSGDLLKASYEKNVEDMIKHNMAFCVIFSSCEYNCVPHELKFEMFRSTAEDKLNEMFRSTAIGKLNEMFRSTAIGKLNERFRSTAIGKLDEADYDYWMKFAVVDSVPYLYFLQYKVYTKLNKPAEKLQALDNLIRTIDTGEDLSHRETALNLLGQCMEQENRINDALFYYKMSLKMIGSDNAAKWHLCRLLARMFKTRSNDL